MWRRHFELHKLSAYCDELIAPELRGFLHICFEEYTTECGCLFSADFGTLKKNVGLETSRWDQTAEALVQRKEVVSVWNKLNHDPIEKERERQSENVSCRKPN